MIKRRVNIVIIVCIILIALTSSICTYFALLGLGAIKPELVELTYEMRDIVHEYDGNTVTATQNDFILKDGELQAGHYATFYVDGELTEVGKKEVYFSVVIKDINNIDVTNEYKITCEYSMMEVTPRKLKLDILDYNKNNTFLSPSEYSCLDDTTLAPGHKVSYTLESVLLNGERIEIFNPLIIDPYGRNVTENYNLTYILSEKQLIDLSITSLDYQKEYDGFPISYEYYSIYNGKLADGHRLDVVFDKQSSADAGIYANTIRSCKILDSNNNDVTPNYKLTLKEGVLTINKKNITVYGTDVKKEYDGQSVLLKGYNTALTLGLLNGHTLNVEYSEFKNTNAGTYASVINNCTVSSNGIDISSNYKITTVDGTIEITKRKLTVYTTNVNKVYDGEVVKFDDSFIYTDNNLVAGDKLSDIEYTQVNTKAVINDLNSINTDKLKVYNGTVDATENYNIVYNFGTFIIQKKDITVYAQNYSFEYTGKKPEVGKDYLYVHGLVGSDTLSEVVYDTANIKETVGNYVLKMSSYKLDNLEYYNVIVVPGILEITPKKIIINPYDFEKEYDGENVTSSNIKVDINDSNFKYDIEFYKGLYPEGKALTKISDAGTYLVKIKHKIEEKDVKNYEFIFTDSKVVINKKEVTFKVKYAEVEYGKNIPTEDKEISDKKFVPKNLKYTYYKDGKEIKKSDIKDAGIYDVVATFDKNDNYNVTITNNVLKISKKVVEVTIKLKDDVSTIKYGELVPTISHGIKDNVLADYTFEYKYNLKDNQVVRSGEHYIGFESYKILDSQKVDITKNFDVQIKEAKLTVSKIPLTISANNTTTIYNGQKQYVKYETEGLLYTDNIVVDCGKGLIDVGYDDFKIQYSVYNQNGEDVTECYEQSSGSILTARLTINKRELIIASENIILRYSEDLKNDNNFDSINCGTISIISGSLADGHYIGNISFDHEDVSNYSPIETINTFDYDIYDQYGNKLDRNQLRNYDITEVYGIFSIYEYELPDYGNLMP